MSVLPLGSCVTLGNFLNTSELQFLFQLGQSDEIDVQNAPHRFLERVQ